MKGMHFLKKLISGVSALLLITATVTAQSVANRICLAEPASSGECDGSAACNSNCTAYTYSGPCNNCRVQTGSTCFMGLSTTVTRTATPGTCNNVGYNCVCTPTGTAGPPSIVICRC